MEGRVEVCVNQMWGTVCNNQWSPAHTRVVCRYLGFNDNEGNVTFSCCPLAYGANYRPLSVPGGVTRWRNGSLSYSST